MTDTAPHSPSAPPAQTADGALNPDLTTDKAPTFDVLPLSKELRETLAQIGYVHPTPVQIAVWEPATRGRDAVVQARTGTGKTAAFGLPIVDHIVKRGLPHVQVLALTPTRELALQIGTEIERLGQKKGVKVVSIYGGAPMQRQIDAINGGAQVVTGTPGRVLDHLRRGTLDPKHIKLVVLDESDEMLSMGFERELTAILETLPPERQTLLFSATLPPDIERIAKNKLKNPDLLTLSGDHVGALSIQHFVYMVASDKVKALIRVLEVEDPESAVIFCNTKDETQVVAQALNKKGFDADWLNGDLPQNDREKVMAATREGRLRYLVATDVAARGIDISHLTHVINHDFPMDAEAYVHRTGRTGRAGRTGTAISLVAPRDIGQLYLLRLTYKIRPVEKQIPSEGELKTRAEADLVGMLAEAFTAKPVHPDDLALARRLLTHDQADRILAGLLRDHLGARPEAKETAAAARRAPRPQPQRAPAPAMPRGPRAGDTQPIPVMAEAPKPRPNDAPMSEPADTLPGAPSPIAASPVVPAPRAPAERQPDRPRSPERERDGNRGDRGGRGRRDDRGPRPNRDAVAHGSGTLAGNIVPAPADGSRRSRPADLVSWQPPAEEGDDDPILGDGPPTPRRVFPAPRPPRAESTRPDASAAVLPKPGHELPPGAALPPGGAIVDQEAGDWIELYVSVGRREGARALDLQRVLVESGGVDKANVRRVRVRDRNAFVSVLRADVDRSLAALNGATIGSKTATAEIARSSTDREADPSPRLSSDAVDAPKSGPTEDESRRP